ncbi:ABC transporter substrate-binding protein [Gordonia sp. PS3]|uniref:ABC transporter substrate-binding protein n=1 Tax=Gordonia TaxID=2053 RepID=UPI0005EF0715|nr:MULTISPECIES: ABC transporter substrate-binding protein [Gordonia]KJR09995.1 ABC transporter substrate-binding protein [Gordonia sihwensis]KXT56272.1 ABC transporter substrate-binding protein [Gordonia sp. QH-12]MBY4570561.1 ABC transporter substrate-binding protein [Gordonia sihwensis]WFN91302.1 ABC transporter substrate-binding protein [Gordonia sihwensis]
MRVRSLRVRVLAGVAAAALAVPVLSGCVVDESALDTKPITVKVEKQPEIAAMLPASIRESGVLRVGTNPPYQPNEFKDREGHIIGFDVDLMNAVAGVLGLRAEYSESDFDKIIPAMQGGTFDLGMSSFTDSLERQKEVDFVDYFSAGIKWAQKVGRGIDPDNACGLRVGVQSTTVEDTDEVPAKSAACEKAGKDPIIKVKFETQDQVVNALLLGQIDAFSADSPVTAYAIKKTDGQLEEVGPLYDAAPYGWPIVKGSALGPALQAALQYLIDNGQYEKIATHWGVEAGMIQRSEINGAKG